jgi:hypothetical protein
MSRRSSPCTSHREPQLTLLCYTEEDPLTACLDLTRRLPPQAIESNLELLCSVLPDLADDLLGSVDQPLKIKVDGGGRQYLVSLWDVLAEPGNGRADDASLVRLALL